MITFASVDVIVELQDHWYTDLVYSGVVRTKVSFRIKKKFNFLPNFKFDLKITMKSFVPVTIIWIGVQMNRTSVFFIVIVIKQTQFQFNTLVNVQSLVRRMKTIS